MKLTHIFAILILLGLLVSCSSSEDVVEEPIVNEIIELTEEEMQKNREEAKQKIDFMYKLMVVEAKDVYDADYNGVFHFTVENRIDLPIIAFEMGYNELTMPYRNISIKRYKKTINPGQRFTGKFNLDGVPAQVPIYAVSVITSNGQMHHVKLDVSYNPYQGQRLNK